MKSVVRIQRQGKVKDVGLRALATVPGAESVDSKGGAHPSPHPAGPEGRRRGPERRGHRPGGRVVPSQRRAPWGGPVVPAAGLGLPPGPEAPCHVPAGAGSAAEYGDPPAHLPAAPAAAGRRHRALPHGPRGPVLSPVRGLRGGGPRGLRPEPLDGLPSGPPGERDDAAGAWRAAAGGR